jgi:hypothetical protein
VSAPAAAADIASRLFAGETMDEGNWHDACRLLRGAFIEAAAPAVPAGLFGRPCALPAAAWHLQQLDEVRRESIAGSATPERQARQLYHRRMLAHLIEPEREALRPLVTVLIPVYNRSRLLVEAIRSCLEQSWRPIEILVIDDGSDDDPAAALREFGNTVRLHRKPNGGVASARNAGIRLARGDFIHLLDSDDLLLPDAVARKVDAFAAIPDAALCFSMAIERSLPGVEVPRIRAPDGGGRCATSDLLHAALNRCPFYVPTVMMPRWIMLALPPFEEELRRGEDSRYWVTLALAGAKAIGMAEPLTIRRMVPDGLSVTPHVGDEAVDIKLRNLRDILRTPSAWHHARIVLARLASKVGQAGGMADGAPHRIPAYREVMATLTAFGDGLPRSDLSPVPLLVDMRDALDAAKPSFDPSWPLLWRDLSNAILSAMESAAPMTSRDLFHWAHRASRSHRVTSKPACLFRSLLKAAEDEPAMASRIDPVLRRTFPAPSPRTVRRFRKLRRKFRSGLLAAWLAWPAAYLRLPR